MRRHVLQLILSLLVLCVVPLRGHAQVRQCVLPNGTLVYTDQRCEALGAQPRSITPSSALSASTPQLRSYRPACPRTLRDLAYEVSSAVDAHDVNRLASVYLWDGIGTRAGYQLMDRLQVVVDRPLVDLQPVWPGDEPYPSTVPTRPPVALRLDQTSARGSTPVRVAFGLRKYLDCWWIVEGGARRTARPAPSADDTTPPASDTAPTAASAPAPALPPEPPAN